MGRTVFSCAHAPARPRAHAFLLAFTIVTLVSGCAEPPEREPVVTPPVFFDGLGERDGLFAGKSIDEVRRLLRTALDAPVTASFRSATLQTVVKELSRKTGLGIGITPDVCAGPAARPIDLDLHNMRARHALDWITRLIGAHYVVEGPRTVFITRDRTWASQDRLRMKSYGVGTFIRIRRPVAREIQHTREAEELLLVFRYSLRHAMAGRRDATIVFDETGSRLAAVLPPRGHAKLKSIIEELKRPEKYEPPASDAAARERAARLATAVFCDFPRQDIRRVADELGLRANVNIGFDYRLILEDRRNVALALGETSLGEALDALAKAAGLGQVVAESDRRFWILGKKQTRRILRTTGELPWDRAVVRSHYVKQLVDHFGVEMMFNVIRKAVTPGEWDADLPVAFYHAPTGRLVVIHDPEAQRAIADAVDRIWNMAKPKVPGGE